MSDPNSLPSRAVTGYIHGDQILHREITKLRDEMQRITELITQVRLQMQQIQTELEEARPHIQSAQRARDTLVTLQATAQFITAIGALIVLIYGAGDILDIW